MMPFNHHILWHPLFVLSSIFPSIRVFSIESVLQIRWPKYWSFSFSISPSSEYSGLISFWIDQFDPLSVQGTLTSLLNTAVQKHQYFSAQLSLWFFFHIHTSLLENPYFTRWNLSSKVKCLLLSVLSRMVITFLPRSMLSGNLERIYQGSPNNEKNYKPMKQGVQMWVVPDLVESAVHVPGENEQPSTWHTHLSAPPLWDPPHVGT